MGTIRMVMLDGLAVADLLALRQGGFFEGAEVALPSAGGKAAVQLPVMEVGASVRGPVSGGGFTMVGPHPAEPVAASVPDSELTRYRPVPADPPPAASYTAPTTVPAGVLTFAPQPTPEQQAQMDEFKREMAEVRAEYGIPAAEAESAPAPAVSADAAGLPSVAQLSGCTKLRDVLQLLIEGGLPAGDLTAYLESIRDQVPLLQRIQNIGERVSRTLSVMGQGA